MAAGRAAQDLQQIARSFRGLGALAYQQGDISAARKLVEEGLVNSRKINDNVGIAGALGILGDLARAREENAEAFLLLEESLTITRQLGNKESLSNILLSLGMVAFGEGVISMRSAIPWGRCQLTPAISCAFSWKLMLSARVAPGSFPPSIFSRKNDPHFPN